MIFHKDTDFEAFERFFYEALQMHQIELYPLLSAWPISPLPGWEDRVKTPQSEAELGPVQLSAQRGKRLRDDDSAESISHRLNGDQPSVHAAESAFDSPKNPSKRPDPFASPKDES